MLPALVASCQQLGEHESPSVPLPPILSTQDAVSHVQWVGSAELSQCFPSGHVYNTSSVQKDLFLTPCHPTEGALQQCLLCPGPHSLSLPLISATAVMEVAWKPRPALCWQLAFHCNGPLKNLSALQGERSYQPWGWPSTSNGGCPVDKCSYLFQFTCYKHL